MAKFKDLDIVRLKDGRTGVVVAIWGPDMYSVDVGTGSDDDPFDNIELYEDELEPFNYLAPRHCPVYNEVVSDTICKETKATLSGKAAVEAVPEMSKISDLDIARELCRKCIYRA